MLAWVVIYRPHPHRSPLSRRSFHLSSHLSIFTVVHPLSVQQLTKCSPRNSFVFKTIHFDGGGCVLNVQLFKRFDLLPSYPLSYQTLAHPLALFCTLQKFNSFLFKRFRALRQKTQPPAVGRGGQYIE